MWTALHNSSAADETRTMNNGSEAGRRKETHLKLVEVSFCAFCNDLGIEWLALLGLSYGLGSSLEWVRKH